MNIWQITANALNNVTEKEWSDIAYITNGLKENEDSSNEEDSNEE